MWGFSCIQTNHVSKTKKQNHLPHTLAETCAGGDASTEWEEHLEKGWRHRREWTGIHHRKAKESSPKKVENNQMTESKVLGQ